MPYGWSTKCITPSSNQINHIILVTKVHDNTMSDILISIITSDNEFYMEFYMDITTTYADTHSNTYKESKSNPKIILSSHSPCNPYNVL